MAETEPRPTSSDEKNIFTNHLIELKKNFLITATMKFYIPLLIVPLFVVSCANTPEEVTNEVKENKKNINSTSSRVSSPPIYTPVTSVPSELPPVSLNQKNTTTHKVFPEKTSPFGKLKNETEVSSENELEVNITPVSKPSEQIIKPPSGN